MKSQLHLTRLLVAIGITIASAITSAAPLLEYQGTSSLGVTNQNQPLASVLVGPNDVTIGGFGVFGQAQVAGNLKWVIFDAAQLGSPVFLSQAQAVSARPGTFATQAIWYDSPAMNFTLVAGHTYAMGLMSDRVGTSTFYWGASPDTPFAPRPTTPGDGLTLNFLQKLDNSGITGCTAAGLCAFTNTPTLYGTFADSNRRKMSLHIAAVPEPSEWAMLVVGLAVIGFMASRRKQTMT
jgi:hypothetical protein